MYSERIRDIPHMKTRIEHDINEIRTDKELLARVCMSVEGRVEAGGAHFARMVKGK